MRFIRHFQGLKAFWFDVLSKVRRNDEEVESMKSLTGVMCMLKLNFSK